VSKVSFVRKKYKQNSSVKIKQIDFKCHIKFFKSKCLYEPEMELLKADMSKNEGKCKKYI